MKRPGFLLSILLAAALCSCGVETCSLVLIYGLNVTVVDDVSGRELCSADVTAVDGSYSEPLTTFTSTAPCAYVGAGEREGTYEIRVEAAGYQPRTITDVEVEDGGCHVKPQTVEVRLQPN
ncbi:MAG: carboxypeptidase-like regulatory domain-containing protein [Deltaproteobacteria bacterium]|jgi:hypothetical protein